MARGSVFFTLIVKVASSPAVAAPFSGVLAMVSSGFATVRFTVDCGPTYSRHGLSLSAARSAVETPQYDGIAAVLVITSPEPSAVACLTFVV